MLSPLLLARFTGASEYSGLPAAADTSAYGQRIQRSMRLMATSTPAKRNTVRILYYGQSIVGQRWSEQVDDYLRETYPHTNFVTANLALGGFSSPRLVRTMHYDALPFYPDLLVFHVYGSHVQYEEIIREIRTRTTAEVIIQTDHANTWPGERADSLDAQENWADQNNYWHLPRIADAHGCSLQPQRAEWAHYLTTHGLEPSGLLTDSVHLNEHGKWLMAELLKRFLCVLPEDGSGRDHQLVRTYEVGSDVDWSGDVLTLPFDGNRVTAVAGETSGGEAKVLVDGRPPSAYPELYTFTRSSGTPHIGWPAIQKFTWTTPPVLEDWTLTVDGFDDAHENFSFTLEGSVTGPDGGGTAQEPFVSDSGRVVIDPQDWVFAFDRQVSEKPTPDGYEVTWSVAPLFADDYSTPTVHDPSIETETTLAQGLTNGAHTLEIVASGGRPDIKALRVSRPPM
ncbi:SGNH/GDSL hydrolase family protein [Candidatus Poribacteria bacterium]|nr:SGNH/GDSL hydrolase family protein [Candidatus Poribacteria bacterium]MBT5535579.1 SGNH/GDSL hydrolase family protein [Candidatus Poribacteria bacterium]MBT5713140.1 SGNH/GDSL hydrolase family protein [Candidatus Poribacteria bacterium]MBT7805354.1 SGNH/GDSL hydrolase family protein [Candidatus Poribacteria bacterium]